MPSVKVEVMLVIVGTIRSITIALLAPKELAAAGAGKVKIASVAAAFLIVTLFKDRAVVET